jgi:hypothetical protein
MAKLSVTLFAALVLVSVSGCRDLLEPAEGYLIVPNVLSPVRIRTAGLEGVGWIKALEPQAGWTTIFSEPAGAFTYDQTLPPAVWHCDPANGSEGCVAVLQAGDERGELATGNVQSRIYVCTANYVQKVGRKHCRPRTIEVKRGLNAPYEEEELLRARSTFVGAGDYAKWHADLSSRLFAGSHTFETSTGNPWEPPNPGDVSGSWREWPWGSFSDGLDPMGADIYNVDIGTTSVFIPWKWEDRHAAGAMTVLIGLNTGKDANGELLYNEDGSVGLGLGELLVDAMRDNTEPMSRYSQDVKRWWNALTNISPRTDKSPEFHFRVQSGERQMCLVQYMRANNKINGKPDAWYRLDQAFASLFLQWFGIGDCPTHSLKVRYCGVPSLRYGDAGFQIDPSSIDVQFEPYSARPACNNQFIPQLQEALPEILMPMVEISIGEGLQTLVDSFSDLLGADIRRLEITPTGAYLIVADSIVDVQYGTVGECLPEIGAPKTCSVNLQPPVVLDDVPASGITRPVTP